MKSHLLFGSAGLAALSACSGEQAPPPPAPAPVIPASVAVASSGTITGFGSVSVNGVRYEIENGTIVAVEDEAETSGDDSALRLGMRVDIEATQTSGVRTADRIEYDEDLKGAAENVTPDANDPRLGTFTVAGQTVTVDANTVFDNDIGNNDGVAGVDIRDLDPANLPGNAPMVVEVSGFPTDAGVLATRIDRVNAAAADIGDPAVDGDEIEVKGFVDSVAMDGSSFVINDATFLVDMNTMFDNGLFANADLVGVFVEVKADINGSGEFVAVRVEREDDFAGGGRDGEFEIEGILQSVDTSSDPDTFVVNGVVVETVDASSLLGKVGSRVEVKGSFNSAGVLVIREAELDVENSIRTEDRIAMIDTAGGFFTTRLGLDIAPTEMARVEDAAAPDGDHLTPAEFLGRLMNDDFIEARGFPNDGGGVTWTRIERDDENDRDCRLRGPVEDGSISDPTFVILGVTIDTAGLGFDDFKDEDDTAIGRMEFFNRLQPGDVVQATSDTDGAGCVDGQLSTAATGEIEFEPDDGIEGNAPDDENEPNDGAAAEIAGLVSELDANANTFVVAGRTVTVTPDTLIDDSIVEAARGQELGDNDFRFGDLPETLDQLLSNGDPVKVRLDANGNALRIEDNS